MRSRSRALVSAVLVLALAAACGDEDRPASPTSPSATPPGLPVLVASVPSAPLTAPVSGGPSGQPVHTVAAEVAFRETTGAAGRIVQLTAAIVDEAGTLVPPATQPLDIEIAALGTARHDLRFVVELQRQVSQGRLRLAYQARSASGASVEVAPIEVPVRFEAAPPPPVPSFTVVGAGDIGLCGSAGPEATAQLLDGIPGLVFTLGDNAYPDASPGNFANCYHPSWGRHRARTRPIAGNHDWYNNQWWAYFDYFGASAGPPGLGYYSYDLGAWHVIALNSNLHGNAGSPQHEWARADLSASRASCILALWHHPRYSSGPSGGDRTMQDIWKLLQEAGAEVVLTGHDHIYERFAPQDADGRLDLARGLRQFVVGTGGYTLYDLGPAKPNSEVRDNRTWGVLRMTLHPTGYDWEFVPIAGRSFRDSGSAQCSR